MNIVLTEEADKNYRKLPARLQTKTDKQFLHLLNNRRHPSLRTKKMTGGDCFEGRIDYHYRFTFIISAETIFILSIGPHDEGLGKK